MTSCPVTPTARGLLIVGGAGTGKTDTAFGVFMRFFTAGHHVAALELDHVGLCGPTPQDDPVRHRVKSEAMGAAWRVYRAHGATRFVVSGGMVDASEAALYTDRAPDVSWFVCRLRVGAAERRRRTEARGALLGQPPARIEELIAGGIEDERLMDHSPFWDALLDTDGLDRAAVVDATLRASGWAT